MSGTRPRVRRSWNCEVTVVQPGFQPFSSQGTYATTATATATRLVAPCTSQPSPGRCRNRASGVRRGFVVHPRGGLSFDIVRIRRRTSAETGGRLLRRRLFHVQKQPDPCRCDAMTVSGFTITSAVRHSVQATDSQAQSRAIFMDILGLVARVLAIPRRAKARHWTPSRIPETLHR